MKKEFLSLLTKNINDSYITNDFSLSIISSDNFENKLKESQNEIIGIDKEYIQKFVKIGLYLKSTELNIFNLYKKLLDDNNGEEFGYLDFSHFKKRDGEFTRYDTGYAIRDFTGLPINKAEKVRIDNWEEINREGRLKLKKQINNMDYSPILKDLNNLIISYENLFVNANDMLECVKKGDLIRFYEIFEVFDKLGIFDTAWQKKMLSGLTRLNKSIEIIGADIKKVNKSINESMELLSSDIGELSSDIRIGFERVESHLN
jgi:hypothetical protein